MKPMDHGLVIALIDQSCDILNSQAVDFTLCKLRKYTVLFGVCEDGSMPEWFTS